MERVANSLKQHHSTSIKGTSEKRTTTYNGTLNNVPKVAITIVSTVSGWKSVNVHLSCMPQVILPMHSSVTSGRSSQTGKTPASRIISVWFHCLAQMSSLKLRQSSFRMLCKRLLESQSWKMERQRKGSMASLHSGVGGGWRLSIKFLAFLSPVCWSIMEGMFRAGGGDVSPEKHICREVRASLQTSPE